MQVHIDKNFFQQIQESALGITSTDSINHRLKAAFLISGWESLDVEDQLYTLFYALSYKEFEHPWILVAVGGHVTNPHPYYRMTEVLGDLKVIHGCSGAWSLAHYTTGLWVWFPVSA